MQPPKNAAYCEMAAERLAGPDNCEVGLLSGTVVEWRNGRKVVLSA